MGGLYCLVTIVRRELGEKFMTFYKKNGIRTHMASLCNGTAQQKTLDYLGLEKTEKIMITSFLSDEARKKVSYELVSKMHIDVPGNGIAMAIPMESVGGKSALDYLAPGQEAKKGAERDMNATPYTLIVAIAESGTTDTVMDAARSAGARGGTVVHAKGTANDKITSSFFGVTVASEKEMVYIVSKRADRDIIMKSIMEKAGPATDAKAVVFSLPVDSVVGLRSLTDAEQSEE